MNKNSTVVFTKMYVKTKVIKFSFVAKVCLLKKQLKI